jgi:hypothetical protein
MKAPPFVLDRGLWSGVLRLIVLECIPGSRAYGVEIDCQIYGAFEEAIYSIANHGNGSSSKYDGTVYLKEAVNSHLLNSWNTTDLTKRKARQFLFVGSDFCYETLGFRPPLIRTFASRDEAYDWPPGQHA